MRVLCNSLLFHYLRILTIAFWHLTLPACSPWCPHPIYASTFVFACVDQKLFTHINNNIVDIWGFWHLLQHFLTFDDTPRFLMMIKRYLWCLIDFLWNLMHQTLEIVLPKKNYFHPWNLTKSWISTLAWAILLWLSPTQSLWPLWWLFAWRMLVWRIKERWIIFSTSLFVGLLRYTLMMWWWN